MSPSTPLGPGSPDLELVRMIAQAVAAPTPVDLLGLASSLVAVDDAPAEPRYDFFHPGPDHRPEVSAGIHHLATTFLDAAVDETDALLRVWAEMLGDELLAKRVSTGLKSRTRRGPDWLARIDETRPVNAVSMTHVLGHEETIFLGLTTAGLEYTLAVAIEHSGTPFLQDAYPIPQGLAEVREAVTSSPLDGVRIADLPLADAGARIHSAAFMADRIHPPIETDTWPAMRALLDWVVSLLPADGRGFDQYEWTPEEIDGLVTDFLASSWAEGLDQHAAMHAERLLSFQADYGSGEPLRWGGQFVAAVMGDLYPRKVLADDDFMLSMPTTLRALVQYANERSGVPAEFTQNALEAIDDLFDEYRASVLDDGEADPLETTQEQFMELLGGSGLLIDLYEGMLWEIGEQVGGAETLRSLSLEPLPREELDTSRIPDDLVPRVQSLGDQVAALAESSFDDPELRTAALRILATAAANGPEVFRRRFTDPPTVAAVCWIAGRINHWFAPDDPDRRVTAFMQRAGVKNSPTQRAAALRSAIRPAQGEDTGDGVDWDPAAHWLLGDPALLTSTARTGLAEARDRYAAELSLLQDDEDEW